MTTVQSATLAGLDACSVTVEGTFHKGLPGFSIVGLPNEAIKESRDRVKAALLSSGFSFPPLKVTIGLSPGDIAKNGSHFDLPIALMIALQKLDVPIASYYVFGELGLDGTVKHTAQLFPLILALSRSRPGLSAVIPHESAPMLASVPGLSLFPVGTLKDAVDFFTAAVPPRPVLTTDFQADVLEYGDARYFYDTRYPLDFSDIKGQRIAKRAALIAAAGFHNILLEGSPGCGKSMTVKRLAHILPPLSSAEMLDSARLETLEGKDPSFAPRRPFRSPHHSSTRASIFGGGSRESKIGEAALAHNGVLYFDELPFFDKNILEALREPLEDHRILISRVNTKIEYPTKFLFAASQNPCPCGNLLSNVKECRCSERDIQRYKNRLSEPFLDRIDLFVQMDEPSPDDRHDMTSAEMHRRVMDAFLFRKERGQEEFNGKLSEEELARFCPLDDDAAQTLVKGSSRFALSYRAQAKVIRIARTLADLEGSVPIRKSHIVEAMSYRRR